MRYELYYWPTIQGRGEFIRLALEEAGADYVDVAREHGRGMGVPAMMRLMEAATTRHPSFAPPFLRAGRIMIGQTANVLHFLGPRLGLVPKAEAQRLWAHQIQLTVADFIIEVHDVHHPVGASLYYEDQKPESLRRAPIFTRERAPQFLGYFERILRGNSGGKGFMIGRSAGYVDLSMFQIIAGMRYAFPNAMARLERKTPRLVELHDRITQRPNIAAYLASKRRIPFNRHGIFRHYPELDV